MREQFREWVFKTFFQDKVLRMAHLEQEYYRMKAEHGALLRNWHGTESDLAELRARRMGLWK